MSEPYYCENYIDIFSVSNFKLAIYPQYIVFGQPIFDISSQKVKFNCQTSLKIPEDCQTKDQKLWKGQIQKKNRIISTFHLSDKIPKEKELSQASWHGFFG